MTPSLKQLRYLVAIADTLHFRRAAEQTHVSQPTLSGQLRELEHRLGVQLVERSRSRVVLTPIGKEVATRARTVLRGVQDLVERAKSDQDILGGTLRLGVLATLGPYLLRHILPELHQSYPNLKLYIREGTPDSLRLDLDEGRLDLLILGLPVKGAEISTARLFREPLMIAASSDHPLAKKDFVERADLKGETILALQRGYQLHNQVRELCELYGAEMALDYEGTSLDTLRQMVGMGMGLSFLPALYVRSEVPKDDEVVARPLRNRPPTRTAGLIWRRHSARSDEFATLAEVMRGIIKGGVPEVTTLS